MWQLGQIIYFLSAFSKSFTISMTRFGASMASNGMSFRMDHGPNSANLVVMWSVPKDSLEIWYTRGLTCDSFGRPKAWRYSWRSRT